MKQVCCIYLTFDFDENGLSDAFISFTLFRRYLYGKGKWGNYHLQDAVRLLDGKGMSKFCV